MGKILSDIEEWWIKNNFLPNKNMCLTMQKNYHPVEGGKDIKIASIFPLVCNPNFVPLSWSKLNSVYLDLR